MYKLLIVDDEPKIRCGLRLGYPWGDLGFEIAGEASNGSEALDYIAVHPVDIVLADINMPVLSGIELAMQLHELKSHIKVVLLTVYKEFEYAQKAVKYGVYEYLVKPTGYDIVISTFTRIKDTLDHERSNGRYMDETKRPDDNIYDKLISAVYTYVEDNLPSANLEGAADTVGRSTYYLSRLFKKHTDQNFSDYVMDKKMNRAALLLSGYRYKVNEVSALVGYDSPKNFSRAFKSYFGKCPRDYRCSPQRSRKAHV